MRDDRAAIIRGENHEELNNPQEHEYWGPCEYCGMQDSEDHECEYIPCDKCDKNLTQWSEIIIDKENGVCRCAKCQEELITGWDKTFEVINWLEVEKEKQTGKKATIILPEN